MNGGQSGRLMLHILYARIMLMSPGSEIGPRIGVSTVGIPLYRKLTGELACKGLEARCGL